MNRTFCWTQHCMVSGWGVRPREWLRLAPRQLSCGPAPKSRHGTKQGPTGGQRETGPFGPAGSQKPALCPVLGSALVLEKSVETVCQPELAGTGRAASEELGWGCSRVGDLQSLPVWSPGPFSWSRSAWQHAPCMPPLPGVHLSHPNFHLAPWPSAVALPVLPLLARSAQDRLPGRTRRESRPLYP